MGLFTQRGGEHDIRQPHVGPRAERARAVCSSQSSSFQRSSNVAPVLGSQPPVSRKEPSGSFSRDAATRGGGPTASTLVHVAGPSLGAVSSLRIRLGARRGGLVIRCASRRACYP